MHLLDLDEATVQRILDFALYACMAPLRASCKAFHDASVDRILVKLLQARNICEGRDLAEYPRPSCPSRGVSLAFLQQLAREV